VFVRKQEGMTDQTEAPPGDEVGAARWRGRRLSLETRGKMSAAAKSRPRSPLSPETRAKISIANSRKRGPQSAEHRAKIAAGWRKRREMKKTAVEERAKER
jgi:hypothetical protein